MTIKIYSLNEVSERLKVKPYRIVYALKNGDVPEPELTLMKKRVFSEEDVQRLKDYFQKKQQRKENEA